VTTNDNKSTKTSKLQNKTHNFRNIYAAQEYKMLSPSQFIILPLLNLV